MLDVERMSESDVMNGKQVFSFIISMVIKSVPFSNKYTQGRSQRGVQGVQLNPPSKLMIFMAMVYTLWKN